MFKILIVDDELLVRANIKMMIEWEKNDFTVCGEATNGQEALEFIEKVKPDILLCDICMPNMSGLQLLLELKSKHPSIRFIMLSNYDDYEYVRGALSNGAIDYILKHKLNGEILLKALLKAKASLLNEMDRNESYIQKDTSMDKAIAYKEQFVKQILTGFYKEIEIKEQLQMHKIQLDTSNVAVILFVIDDYKLVTKDYSLKDVELLKFSIINIADELIHEKNKGIISHISNEKFAIVLSFENNRSSAFIENALYMLVDRISFCLKKFINISVSFGMGNLCNNIMEIPISYENAEKALMGKFFKGKNSILKTTKQTQNDNSPLGLSIDTEKLILSFYNQREEASLFKELQNIFDNILRNNISVTGAQIIFNDILSLINRICKENNFEINKLYSENKAPYEMLASIDTLEQVKSWIFSLFKILLNLKLTDSKEFNSEYVKKCITYIKQHYSQNISLATVAEELNISSAYLSKLFKENVGTGFSEFLCEIRLEKAKALLMEDRLEMKQIVDLCGFNNYTYFFNVFKSRTGISPKKFIKSIKL